MNSIVSRAGRGFAAAAVAAMLLAAGAASAAGTYDGKKITLWIGGGVAGGVNAYGRLVTRHIGKFLPGTPTFVAKNLPGAGGMGAVTTLYNRARKDGTAFATFALGPVTDPLLRKKKMNYDMLKFNWLGSLNSNVQLCHTRKPGPIKTLADARNQVVTVGSTGARSNSAKMPLTVNAALGTRFKVIIGYRGSGGTALAFERGEVMGRCNSMGTLLALRGHWFTKDQIHKLVQIGARKHPAIPNVPWAQEIAPTAEKKAVLNFVSGPMAMSQPFTLPPGTPNKRVGEWRKAFDAMVASSAFRAEAKKRKMELDTKTGDEVMAVIKSIYATPKNIVKLAAEAISRRRIAGRCDPNVSKKCRKAKKRKKKK